MQQLIDSSSMLDGHFDLLAVALLLTFKKLDKFPQHVCLCVCLCLSFSLLIWSHILLSVSLLTSSAVVSYFSCLFYVPATQRPTYIYRHTQTFALREWKIYSCMLFAIVGVFIVFLYGYFFPCPYCLYCTTNKIAEEIYQISLFVYHSFWQPNQCK